MFAALMNHDPWGWQCGGPCFLGAVGLTLLMVLMVVPPLNAEIGWRRNLIVSPYQIPGTSQQRLKVVLQGKQSKPIVDYLMERGIPKKWIEVSEVVGKK
jgi:hypothetical protein